MMEIRMKKARVVALTAALFTLSCAWAADHGAPHWEYTGKTGAEHWGDLQSDFATCKLGKEQSPIDIQTTQKAKLPAIGFAYTAGPAEVVNNGHTVQVNLKSGGTVQLESGSYQLLQFHFHTPSEEKINGKAYPLVAHFVHRNAAGQLAVVGVLFQEGRENAALAPVFAAMPTQANKTAALAADFQPAAVLPQEQGYYAFIGSLTTPPCSEGVRWQVLKQPVEVSKAQLAAFQKLYPMNARPVQALGSRVVRASE
jgi:carbonic anhydrase